jgi:DNA-binding winged helix-turn-helix (wHTH) protein/Tfp pilus assembly protein PilF
MQHTVLDRPIEFVHPVDQRRCEIGPMLLDARGELLLLDGVPLPLGRRAVSLLIRLIERPGELVSREALMEAGWHGLIVEESNLDTQISQLRRTLAQASGGQNWIETRPRRGYRFVGPVSKSVSVHVVREPEVEAALPAAEPRGPSPSRSLAGPPAVALMQFSVRHADLEEFAEGLAEDIVSMLSSLRELVVVSRASSLALLAAGADLLQVGRDLGAGYLISGSVRKARHGVRVLLELADSASGLVLWSRSFETSKEEAPQAPVPIVALIVNTLLPRVREQEIRRLRHAPVQDVSVHQLLLQARLLMMRFLRSELAQAKVLIDHAIARDPHCAPAYAMAAEWHSHQISQAWTVDRAADLAALERNALHAITLDSSNAAALARIGHCRALHHRDFDSATMYLDRALDAGPSYPKAWELSSYVMSWLGDGPAAIRHAERALQLSPADPLMFQTYTALALAHYTEGSFETAITWARRSYALSPRPGTFLVYAAASAATLGRLSDAREFARLFLQDRHTFSVADVVKRHPFRDEERRVRYGTQLLLAGFPP